MLLLISYAVYRLSSICVKFQVSNVCVGRRSTLARQPDQKYIYFMGLVTPASACYIHFSMFPELTNRNS